MLTQNIELLLSKDEKATDGNNISKELLKDIDSIILARKLEISSEAFGIYNKFQPMKQNAPEGMKNELFTVLKNYIKENISNSKFIDALFLTRFLMVKSNLLPDMYNITAEIMSKLDENTLAKTFIKYYELKETNTPLRLLTVGNFYNLYLRDYKTAIKYYEQYLKIDETKSVIYTIIGSLYAKAYGQYSLKEQIYYYEKAYKLKPNDRLILHSLAFGYEKLGDNILANKYYSELLCNNPTDTDYYNYGGFLIRSGNFALGHKYLTHRFNIDDVNLKYPMDWDMERKWNFSDDISQKTLLVMYEQGFGDTIMYCRFVPMLKNIARKIIFVVQDNLYDLIKNSVIISESIEIYSDKTDIHTLNYDCHIALLDVPYVLKTNSETLPYSQGYLTVDHDKISQYKNKYIKSNANIKIGLSCHGSKSANYSKRDIDISQISRLLNIDGIDFYNLNMDELDSDKIISLGKTFNNFTDTACAIKNMDYVISTDNVILNLAGAMGVKTFGLFQNEPNFRWFKLIGNDVGWYKSVIPFLISEEYTLNDILNEILIKINIQ